jgi:gliding motility-associated-like protein
MQAVANPASCNKRDTLRKSVTIKPLPTADFSFAPVIPVRNTPTVFTNLSVNANTYSWDFGDGSGSNAINPSHQYLKTGKWTVCLIARTTEGCADTVCKGVESDVRVGIDIPNAFSPNGDGENEVLYVRGGAIVTMNLKIFNRWGTKVFESSSLSSGWDGTYNGKPLEMDAYAYVLTASFIDGTTAQMQGNVSLVR